MILRVRKIHPGDKHAGGLRRQLSAKNLEQILTRFATRAMLLFRVVESQTNNGSVNQAGDLDVFCGFHVMPSVIAPMSNAWTIE
jgi:hypothetical protein